MLGNGRVGSGDGVNVVQVAVVTSPARETIERAGGTVHKVYYNKLGMRALLLPDWFVKKQRLVPRAVQMVPYKKAWRYDRVGTIPATQAPARLPAGDSAVATA
jgi:large subunit ribosomal protein L15